MQGVNKCTKHAGLEGVYTACVNRVGTLVQGVSVSRVGVLAQGAVSRLGVLVQGLSVSRVGVLLQGVSVSRAGVLVQGVSVHVLRVCTGRECTCRALVHMHLKARG